MNDRACVKFLQWCLPRMGYEWSGFRKVRGQVCKRIRRRLKALGLSGLEDYRRHLQRQPPEWAQLDALCYVSVSRFFRDRGVFAALRDCVLPRLMRAAGEGGRVRAWSVGSCSGEEPYSLNILWLSLGDQRPGNAPRLEIIATERSPELLLRAEQRAYTAGSLKDMPPPLRARAFCRQGEQYVLKARYRRNVRFLQQDIRHDLPDGRFDLILCRNLVFTYFDASRQQRLLQRMADKLRAGGVLVIGSHESLPPNRLFEPCAENRCLYRKRLVSTGGRG